MRLKNNLKLFRVPLYTALGNSTLRGPVSNSQSLYMKYNCPVKQIRGQIRINITSYNIIRKIPSIVYGGAYFLTVQHVFSPRLYLQMRVKTKSSPHGA